MCFGGYDYVIKSEQYMYTSCFVLLGILPGGIAVVALIRATPVASSVPI